jgi:hypothetical protein
MYLLQSKDTNVIRKKAGGYLITRMEVNGSQDDCKKKNGSKQDIDWR